MTNVTRLAVRLTAVLLLLALRGYAQTCFFADDYSNPARWTQLNSGITVAGGAVQVTNTGGGSVPSVQRGLFQPLPTPLPDSGGWRLELTMDYRTYGSSGGLLAVAVAAGDQHPINIFPGGVQTITPQDCIGIITTGSLGARPVPLSIFVSDNGTWSQSRPLTLRQNTIIYLRLERLSSGLLKMSVFDDAARTIHQTGSPVCYMPPGQYTGLQTVWHANVPQGSDLRNDIATLDDLCISQIPVLDTAFTAQASRTRICLGESVTLTAPNAEYAPIAWSTTTPSGTPWTATGASVTYTPTEPGTYVFSGGGTLARFCDRPRAEQLTVEVTAPDSATLAYPQAEYCLIGTTAVSAVSPVGGTFSGSPGLVVSPTTGLINLAASTAGTHVVTYVSGGFCPDTATFPLTILTSDAVAVGYPQTTYCATGTTAPVLITPPGGTFSSDPGLVLDSITGAVDLGASTPSTYTVTYTKPGTCTGSSNFTFRVDPLTVAALGYSASSYCQVGSTPAPVATPVNGGLFSGTPGLIINSLTGVIDLSASTAGAHTVTYTPFGVCPVPATDSLVIIPRDIVTLTYPQAAYCQAEGPAVPTANPAGGVFSSTPNLRIDPITGFIDLTASVLGAHTITYTSTGACPTAATFTVVIRPEDVTAVRLPDSVYCQAGTTPVPTVLPSGGTFSGSSGLVVAASTGVVDLAHSAVGDHTLTYTSAGACSASASISLRIVARSAAGLSYSDTTYCPSGATPVPLALPSGPGIFTATPGLAIDERTGIVDLAASSVGTHSVTFTSNDRCFDPATATFTIGLPLIADLPNVITPNADGLNEALGLPQPPPAISGYELAVFNRWGTRVFRSADPAAPWTAADVAAGTYFYHLRYTDCGGNIAARKGWVEVVK